MDTKALILSCAGEGFKPTPSEEAGKYGKSGLLDARTFKKLGLGEDTARNLAATGNFGLSKATWENYRTAERMLLKCRKETGRELETPLSQSQVLFFIDWLIRSRNAKYGTICSYLAGLRQLHIARGLSDFKIRTELVNLVLTGRRNQETLEKKKGDRKGRLPVTITVMKLIKAELRDSKVIDIEDKLLTWAICCLAFNGAFRIHELLSKEVGKFDPRTTLLAKDIKISAGGREEKAVIVVNVKWPKEDRKGAGTVVEVFETDTDICPVRALQKWWKVAGPREVDMPAFRRKDGAAFTGGQFNSLLKTLLSKHFDYKVGSISAHSFRSGVTTTLGQVGFSDQELQAVGRWSSRAFEHYVKLPRTKRREMAKEIGRL